ncbi:hypothetical protein [Bacteroides acidifaciens]|uniref:hypothetical protein n=1 Tax=Bacteroides acidifaciens TaxID=85831 RepID=UPI0026ED4157|nr:hypothetical protein [Bacteroides acidifaciens]
MTKNTPSGNEFSASRKNRTPETLELQGFPGSLFFSAVLTLRNICGTIGARNAEQFRLRRYGK